MAAQSLTTHSDIDTGIEYHLSIDTGGTFTDGFVSSSRDVYAQVKVDTTPHDLTEGFAECVSAAADAMGEELTSFLTNSRIVHFSSTIATNTVVQSTGARIGLIVTSGAQDSLHGTDEARGMQHFVPSNAVRDVAEEVDDQGRVIHEPKPDALEKATRELLEQGVQVLVVSFSQSHLNPDNERSAKAVIEESYPKHYLGAVPLLLSSQMSLIGDDYGRTALAVVNAYLHPDLSRSLYRAEDDLRRHGFKYPLLIVNTDGSSTRVAKTRAVDTFNSGPSAGVLGAGVVAKALEAEHAVTFDVGGTSTDTAYIASGEVPRGDTTSVGPIRVPHSSVQLSSIGVGGGSLLDVDEGSGKILVGPRSAGAVPGPASFGLGGEQPTPTDVWLALGYLEPGEFLSGRRRLDAERAQTALKNLADRIGTSVREATLMALEAIYQTLGQRLRSWAAQHKAFVEAERSARWLFSYGGGGGLLCVAAAEALDIQNVVVFPHSSVFSAFGGGLLPVAHSYVSAVGEASDEFSIAAVIADLTDRAARDLRTEGVASRADVMVRATLSDFSSHRTATPTRPLDAFTDGRIVGSELAIDSPAVGRLAFDVWVPRTQNLRVALSPPTLPYSTRSVTTKGGLVDVPVVSNLGTPCAPPVTGPAFLAARDTTVFLPDQWNAEFNEFGYGLLRKVS